MIGTVQDITERKQLQEQLRKNTEELTKVNYELQRFTEHLHEVREEERSAIAQELHDELGQALTALRMDTQWIEKHVAVGNTEITDKAKKMMQLIDTTLSAVRRLSSELRPGILDDLGLIPAMDWYCNDFQTRYGLNCTLVHTGSDFFDKRSATALYRILQESLTNVARHAHATEVRVSIHNNHGQVSLEISDNGKGISLEEISSPNTFGITGMRHRISSLNGTMDIHGSSGKGTSISITLPNCG